MAEAGLLFEGLKVLDAASFVVGPAAAAILSDFGADVIKIEPPGAGDPWRGFNTIPGMPPSAHDYIWTLAARNKRSLALDLKRPEAQDVLHRLVAAADVFITNFPLPVRARLGLSYEQLKHLNERLVYASFTAYGEAGAEADKTGFDATAWWARSGLMETVRADHTALPARSMPAMGDHPTALALYGAIATALYRRERTGKGAYVHSSLLASGVWAAGVFVQAALCGAAIPERPVRAQARNALANYYHCRDGRWLNLSITPGQEEKNWPAFAQCVGLPELADDPRFAQRPARLQNAPALVALLDAAFAALDSREAERRLDRAGFNIAVIARITDVVEDPQVLAAGALVPMPGTPGRAMTVDSPLWIAEEKKRAPRPAPAVGEHTEEVLREHGFTAAEIARLREAGAVA